jgi:cob(I)alamin adenosyltransferase
MADLATEETNREKLVAGASKVNSAMIDKLETHIDDLTSRFEMPKEFVVPGQNKVGVANLFNLLSKLLISVQSNTEIP